MGLSPNANKNNIKKSCEHLFNQPMLQRVVISSGWWLLSHSKQQKGKYIQKHQNDMRASTSMTFWLHRMLLARSWLKTTV